MGRTNKGWSNITPGGFETMDKERLREISRKGAKRMLEVKAEKRTAKKCLEDILTLECSEEIIAGAELPPELAEQLKQYVGKLTMYDLLHLVAVGLALGGNMRAMEYIRDTFGDMPTKQISVEHEVMSDADRSLIQKISARLNNPDLLIVADQTPTRDQMNAIGDCMDAERGQYDN